jgi:hypothetical protein
MQDQKQDPCAKRADDAPNQNPKSVVVLFLIQLFDVDRFHDILQL